MPKIVDDEGHALKAILLLVFSMSFIPLNDALIKVMSERLHWLQRNHQPASTELILLLKQ